MRDIIPKRSNPKFNIFLPTHNGSEEIDLLLIDQKEKFILVGELRWMLQPGDVREVVNRKKVAHEKVTQTLRKVSSAKNAIDKILNYLDLPKSNDWRISGIVIIDGFGGVSSNMPKEVPVVPKDIFVPALQLAPSLEHLHATFTSPIWLPKLGIDYELELSETTLCGVPFLRPGINVDKVSYMKETLPDYLSKAFHMTISELQAHSWE